MEFKAILLSFIMISIISLQQFKCPTFKGEELPPGICASKTSPGVTGYNWVFQKCLENQTCNFDPTKDTSSCINKQNVTNLLPGENCTTNSSCYSGNCLNNTRIGKNETSLCVNDDECNVGLYCTGLAGKKLCSPLVENGKTCLKSVDKCYGNSACFNNTCTPFQSLPIGNISDNYLLCSSGYTLYQTVTDPVLRCRDPFNLTNPSPLCNIGESCNYKSQDFVTSIPCRCGINIQGQGVCSNGTGHFQKSMEAFMNFTNQIWKTPTCHISKPFFCLNIQHLQGFNESYVGLQLFHDNVYLDNATQDNVVKSILRSDFWTAFENLPPPPPPPPVFAVNIQYIWGILFFLIILF